MTRVWVLGNPENETNCDLAERWCSLGIPAALASDSARPPATRPGDVVLGRLDVRRSLDGVEPGLLALLGAQHQGVRVLNRAAAVLAAHDKLRTARAFEAAGVPHPRTAHVLPGEAVPLEPPLVLKPRFGSWGGDVHVCRDEDDVARTLATLSERTWFRRQGAIAQELVPPTGYDLRVLVARGAVVGAVRRMAAHGEWRNNVSLGGFHRPIRPSADVTELALAAVAAVGGDFFGVDVLPLSGGHVVLEVNGAVEFADGYSLRQGDVFAEIAEALGLRTVTSRRPVLRHVAGQAVRSATVSSAAASVPASISSTGTR
jgi:tetrahydromethanopterin:alpha-L-glutamate ligase